MAKVVSTALAAIRCRYQSREIAIAIGFSRWKELFLRNLLLDREVIFVECTTALRVARFILRRRQVHGVVWSLKDEELGIPPKLLSDLAIERIEDGFVRSIGRGIDQTMPWSLCVDKTGIYYDATRPSNLEYLCNNFDRNAFKAVERNVGIAMDLLLSSGLTKYNSLARKAAGPIARPNSNAILVLGQVEDDRSLTRNLNAVSTNRDLLARAIADNPNSTIYLKQHPDCLGERRRPGYVEIASSSGILEIDHGVTLPDALASVNTVYTISSLGGFEALLRGKQVVTFGAPFYAGWGLTKDHVSFPRRTRSLTVLQLFYVAYMLYPIYLNPRTGERLTLVEVIRHLTDAQEPDL